MAEMKLRCLKEYGNQFMIIQPGMVVTLTQERAEFVLRDGPDCFEVVQTEVKEIDTAPVDKMLRKGKTK